MTAFPLKLNYRMRGAGPPLIILHGIFGSTINWERIGEMLSREWTVFVLDLRNHGDSPHSPDFGYDDLVEDVRWFMERHGMVKANILGHSLGGKIAMAFTDRFPEMAETLIVVDIAPKPYPSGHGHMLKELINFDLKPIGSLKEAVDRLAPVIPSMAIRLFLLKNLVRGKDGRYHWKINLPAISRHYAELSKGPRLTKVFSKSTLFIRGNASEFIIDEDEGIIEKFFPKFQMVTIDNAGHWLHVDQPEKTSEAIIEFLQTS